MKILKKAMSAFLAALICIPSGILSIVNAAETNPNGDYTVMLTDAENGLLQFSEECLNASTASQEGYNMMQVGEDGTMNPVENDGSIWAFKEGDMVEIETIPGDGYHVESFKVKDSSSGDTVAEKETSDNVFSFTMPGKNVSVEAVFTDKKIPETTESVENTENTETKQDNTDKNNGDDEIPAESNLWVRPDENASIIVLNGAEGLTITSEDGKAFVEDMETDEVTEATDILEDGYCPVYILPNEDGNVRVIVRARMYHSVQDVSVHYGDGEDTGDDTLENSPLGSAASYDIIIPEDGEAKYLDTEMVKNRDKDGNFIQEDTLKAAYSTRNKAMARAATGGVSTNVPSSMDCTHKSPFGGTNRYEVSDGSSANTFNSFCFDPAKSSPKDKTMTITMVTPENSERLFKIPATDIPLLKAAFATCTPIGPKGNNDGLGTLGGKVPGTTEYDMWRDCVYATTGGDVAAHSVEILHVIFSEVAGNLDDKAGILAAEGTGWYELVENSNHLLQIHNFMDKLRVYATENSEALEAYNLFVADPNDGTKQRLIFIEKAPRDPLGLYIFKKGAEGKEAFVGSQLAGAQFEVIYYPNKKDANGRVQPQKYSSAEEAQRIGHDAVQFIFETRSVDKGTPTFADKARRLGYDYGIDFRPLDENANPWVNNFIISGQAKYQTVFGQPGTYVIHEYTPPKGYTLTGEMSAMDGSVKTSNLRTGLALYVERSGDNVTYEINGHPAGSGDVNVGIEVEDEPIPFNVSTVALSMDTGQQYADPKSTNVRLRDSIKIDIPEDKEALYTVKTWVEIAKGKTENEKGNRVAVKWEGDRTATTREKETVFSTASAGVSPGSSYEFFLECSVDAVQQDLAGKTVVFMNQVIVKDGRNGDGPDNNKDGYIWNKTYGEGDTAEMIHFSESNTDIISNQTERKNGLGASIIYAGMYTDGSYTSGGGSIKQELTDTIHYKNLQKNRTYYVVGELIDAETGQPAVDANGTPIKNTVNTQQQHSSSSGTGEWKIVYSFDATNCGGRKYVSFVKVYLGDEMVAHYDKIGDLKESFYIPEITTKLKDSKTGLDVSYAEEQVTFTDTITYRKFLPNVNYKVVTKLINMETKEILKDVNGQDVVSETQFRPTTEDGTKDINITFPAMVKDSDGNIVRSLAGTVIVAYEYIYIERGQEGSGNWVLVADHTDFWDKNQRMYMPLITTTAWDQKTEHHISMAEKYMTIYDKVHYEGIRPEYDYILRSQLVDISTGEVVRDDANVLQEKTTEFKADGDLLANHYLFYGDVIPDEKEKKGVWFTLDAESFAGRTLVVFEELLIETPNGTYTLATHKDLLDEMQTIHIPKVSTSAADGRTGAKTVYADGDRVTVVDTFSYDNLIPGLTYRLEGRVVDKNQTVSTGSEVAVTGTDGKPAKNSDTFTAESSSGSRRLSFDIDLSKYSGDAFQGVELVVFEELYVVDRYDGADHECLVAGHTDISDKNQTVYVPKVTTSLRDRKTGTQVLNPSKDACLVDTINYFRMQPDTEYTVRGKLIDMQTGKVLAGLDGEKAEKEEKRRTDEDGTGKWEIEYRFDASELGGKIIVAYEEVYINSGKHAGEDVMVASHRDFWDNNQRVYIPLVSTVATDQKTNSHITYAEDNAWVTDRIYYSHLMPDTEYRLVSTLVDKETQEVVVDDKGIKQEIISDFTTTPNESQEKYNMTISNPFTDSSDTGIGYSYGYVIPADGTTLPDGSKYHGVVFTFDAHTFEGRTLVIFEELQMRTPDGYQTVAQHKDIKDENQTVHVPKMRTYARDAETGTNVSKMDGQITLHDYFTYENLIPGQLYRVEGVLMDKPNSDSKTANAIKDADGNVVTGYYEFTPDSPNGTAGPVVFKGNADNFQTDEGKFSSETIVAFEKMYLMDRKDSSDEKLLVASHEDINDFNQTWSMPTIRTEVVTYNLDEKPKDGDHNHVIGFAAYKCDYCGTKFYTQQEVEAHLKQTQICKRKGTYSLVTDATIYDTVYYENLPINQTYTLVGTLIDVRTGKAVLINQRQVQSINENFIPGSPNGEADVEFHVNGLELAGGRYVVYEELFLDGVSIAEHKDQWDEKQTFYVPDIKTSAIANATKSHVANTETDAEIIDTVELAGLKENEKYFITSTLMETTYGSSNYGNYFIDASGEVAQPTGWRKKGESVWHKMDEAFSIPRASESEVYDGNISLEVRFVVDLRTTTTGVNFEDRSFVVFQELHLENGTIVGQHKDLLDEQQTIYTGGIHTVALSSSTRGHLMEATDNQWVVDKILYSGLEPKGTYFVTTNVYVKEDSDPISGVMSSIEPLNQGSLMQSKYIASNTGAGDWAINISLPNLEKYAGKTIVIYEEIRKGATDGQTVAFENDLYNEAQSIHIASISTSEADNINGEYGIHYTNEAGKWICDNCKETFTEQSEAEKHIAPIYKCDNCGEEFQRKTDAEDHISGKCKNSTVLRDNQLIRDDNGNVKAELWYQCSGCGARFKTNQECLEHMYGSDVCYTYHNINEKHHSYSNAKSGITDTVTYKNLIPGRKYRVEGSIYNVDTGEFVTDEEGEILTVGKTFTTYTSTNTVKVDFAFDAKELAGYKYAVYETLYDMTPRYDELTASTITDPVVIARHEDPTDKNQIFFIPKLSTQVVDDYTKTNVSRAETTTTLHDTVSFEGLNIGSSDKYIIRGKIMDAETMNPLILADGQEAVADSGEFTVKRGATGTDLQKVLDFTFSTSYLEGKKLVVFENLYLVEGGKEVLIGQHTDIMDEKQATYIPKIRTYAYDMETNEQVSGADESVTIIDKVICTNLVEGKRYRLSATMVNPSTGKPMQDINGHDIVGTLELSENNYNEFTASTTGRTVKTVKFVFDGSNLSGKTGVIHETLSIQTAMGAWEPIAYHNPLPDVNNEANDMDYRNQKIDFPEIGTSVKDAETNTEFVKDGERAKVIDTVTYKNLTGGLEYKVVGTIYDIKHDTLLQDTFNDTFTSTKYFTADESGSGTVDVEFVFNTTDMKGNDYVVFEEIFMNDVSVAQHKDSSDKKQTFKIPTIKTSAVSEDLRNKMLYTDEDAVIIDTVTYENLIPDREYTVEGILMDKATGEPLLDHYGEQITGSAVFKPTLSTGTVDVQFRFNAKDMAGISAVVYEDLFYLGKSIASHQDINDEEQTIYIPKIHTTAKGNETNETHIGAADSIITITDEISYENLLGDETYHVQGTVIDVETGEPAVDENGDVVTADGRFQTGHPDPSSESRAVSGITEVEFQFDATGMRGKTLVIYENIYWHKTETAYLDYQVAAHNDKNDKQQMIHIPEIGTTALDSETKIHITKADDDATIIDTVEYKNLCPGLEYTLEAQMIDLDNEGDIATDDYGMPVEARTTFIPKDWNGKVNVRFNDYEIRNLAGHTLVCFEYLYYNGVLIEHHDNPEDEGQTIHIPKISTKATNYESDSSNAMAEAYINVVDEVYYENLIPGLEYIVKGIIYNKETGQPAIDTEGKKIENSTTFVPETDCGTVDVVFTFNGEGMEETDLVVVEEIFYQGNLHKMESIAVHNDLEDENQSVSIPKITTKVKDDNTDMQMSLANEEISLTDTVKYKGLTVGTEYELVGKLYDAETKEPALDDNNQEIIATTNFTGSEKQGNEEVKFEFSGKSLEGHTLVATEELYVVKENGEMSIVAEHKDLDDVEQTIYIPKARTEAVDNQTSINYSYAGNEVTIKDTISYVNLVVGYSYTAHGVLVDRDTKEPILDASGNEIKAEKAFVPTTKDGRVEITFTFDATGFESMTYNVFEEVACNGKVVAEHKDVNDDKQNIHFPKVSSDATNSENGLRVALANEKVSITDVLHYKNLKAGEEYTVIGTLMDKTTGLPVLDPNINTNPYEVLDNIIERWTCDQCGVVFSEQSKAMEHVEQSATDEHETFTLVLSFDAEEYRKLLESATIRTESTFTAENTDGDVPVEFEFDASKLAGHTVVAYTDILYNGKLVATHKDINDERETIYLPEIKTTATDKESGLHVAKADDEVIINDKVSYKNLLPGIEYIMEGMLVDKKTGETILDYNGNQVLSQKTFTPETPDGFVDVEFIFDGRNVSNTTLVAYEYLKTNDEQKSTVAKHEDIEDEKQTIDIPKIETKAFDSITKQNVVKADEETRIIDRVYYHNLTINETYTVYGTLVDKISGDVITDDNGEEVKAEKSFTAKDHSGYIDIEFVFDATDFTGKTLVAFEELSLKNFIIAEHKDVDDEEQTVYIPKVSTTALNKQTGTHMAYANEKVEITDTVSYSNVAPGEEYTLTGSIVNGENGEVLAGPISKTFTAENETGSINMEFSVNAESLKGKKVVVFEELETRFVTQIKQKETYICNQCGETFTSKEQAISHFKTSNECYDYDVSFELNKIYGENVVVAEHKDLNDVEQTVYVPEIKTNAKDSKTNENISNRNGEIVIVDTVEYNGLQSGVEYTIHGTLMDKKSGKPVEIQGKNITSSVKFVPENNNGQTEIEFKFDAKEYTGEAIVVYEELYIDGQIIADHKDINDKKQTIYLPEIGTTATDINTNEHIGVVGTTAITDSVEYKNLMPGLEYTVKGILMDKVTGEVYSPVNDASGNGSNESSEKGTTAETTFVPQTADGTVMLTFDVNSSKNKSIVVFEELYLNDVIIAEHKNIEDEKQTVQYPEIRTYAVNKETRNKVISSLGKTVIIDRVTYSNLVVGKEYTINGVLVDKKTGEKTQYTSSKTFVAEANNGEVELEFEVDAETLVGKSVVAFESLSFEGRELTNHEDLTDEEQTIDIPEIATHAYDKETQLKSVSYGDKITVVDKVTYHNFAVGEEYTVSGELMLKQGDGVLPTGIKASKTFVPEEKNGTVELEFVIDSTKYIGQSLVAYENVSYKEIEIAKHENPEDENQTVYVPEIKTNASISDMKMSMPSEKTVIKDIVTYRNLVPNMSYILKGTLADKSSGKLLSNGSQPISSMIAFTPKTASGQEAITFEIDTTKCEGMAIVVFEELILNDKVVANHKDINDEEQTVRIPKIATNAMDEITKTKVVSKGESVTILDEVTYESLTPGMEYTIKGELMLKGESATSTGITSVATFTPNKPNGKIVLKFKMDSTKYVGKSLVAYEKIFYKDVEIARHENPEDADQTVYVPSIKTNASIGNSKSASVSKNTVITDKVTYNNLVPGIEYMISGKLVNKSNGKVLSINKKPITSSVKFTPESENGSIEIKFTMDSTTCKGMSVVVFEELSLSGSVVADHMDINDKNQTVVFKKGKDTTTQTESEKPGNENKKEKEENTETTVKKKENNNDNGKERTGKEVKKSSTKTSETKDVKTKVKTGDEYLTIVTIFAIIIILLGVTILLIKKKKN